MALAALVAFVALWTLVPAPVLPLLALAVAVPELSPVLAVVAALTLAAAERFARGRARVAAMLLAAFALGIALVPLLLLPEAIAQGDTEMRAAFGDAWRSYGSDAARAKMRPAPFSPLALGRAYGEPAAVRVERDVPVAGTALAMDVYHPVTAGPHPAIVTIYGGAWIFGDRRQMEEFDRYFAARDAVVVAIEYRHAPAARWPAQRDDVRAALRAVAARATSWSVDPDRVALAGWSAGAQLALVAGADPPPALHVAAVVALYAPTDLAGGYADPPRPDPAGVRRILLALFGAPPEGDALARYRDASPVVLARHGAPPTLLLIGDRDELVRPRFQRAEAAALRAAGARVVAFELPWSNHAFDALPSGIGGQLARYYTERFLAATIGT